MKTDPWNLMVVETEDNVYLGTLDVNDGQVTIRTGMTGRPPVIAVEDVLEVTPAERHPDVERG